MRSFSSVQESNANRILNDKKIKADSQRVELLSAIKKTYGVSNFNILSESEKSVYVKMINEMWDSINGLNEKGLKFVNESEITLSKDSETQEVIKYIQQEFKKNLEDYVLVAINKKVTNNKPANVRMKVAELTGKKFKPENFKQIFKQILDKLVDDSDMF